MRAVRLAAAVTSTGLLLLLLQGASAQEATEVPVSTICPAPPPLTPGLAPDLPGGLIVTAFDGSAIWVYDVARNSRYPLGDTMPCAGACRLSPDGTELLYLYHTTNAYNRMRLDGAVRSMVTEYAGQVEWWSADQFLVFTPGHTIFLLNPAGDDREDLSGPGVVSIQPGGRWAMTIAESGGQPVRALRDLSAAEVTPLRNLPLAPDRMYQNAAAWSPAGDWLAFVAPVGASSSELFGVQPGMFAPERWTNLTAEAGPIRINGQATGELSWSPDGSKIAFWVIPLGEDTLAAPAQLAVIHVLDVESGRVSPLCGYQTLNHTPNPPRLVWSPDSSALAFADDTGGTKGVLIAVNAERGEFHALTSGVAAVNGPANLIAWGVKP
ncbi:MAG: PD40 domain-containing protein [Anaerolineae bacterium]|nr:PD40 domain-containing protein [Anaerolineae bacterium]